jgi:nitroimidazol reductase NimA-like FMN-containing flavoprotein (pyridoxamine 5'-phosphate oxidase superfamily)
VTNILLSIRGNLPYNKNYRSVFVSSLAEINQFLEKRQNVLDDKQVTKIVKRLKGYVAK